MTDTELPAAAPHWSMVNVLDVRDALEVIKQDLPDLVRLIAMSALWVHPETFRRLPCWYPEFARGAPSFKADWKARYTNTNRTTRETTPNRETNIKAGKALWSALGIPGKKPQHWSVCHLWGVDDPTYQATNNIIRDARFYSCVANMVLLPAPLKGATDTIPEVKWILRTCAYHLYGWVCDDEKVADKDVVKWARKIREGHIPPHYPAGWPGSPETGPHSVRVRPFSSRIAQAIDRRNEDIQRWLRNEAADQSRPEEERSSYPYAQVRYVQTYWECFLQRTSAPEERGKEGLLGDDPSFRALA